ncbi:hypothetical protein Tco_1096414, partial [Tanacetum coccineum]
LGWILEEIDVTWAHLEKKRTRLQLYTKVDEENARSGWRRRQDCKETASEKSRLRQILTNLKKP